MDNLNTEKKKGFFTALFEDRLKIRIKGKPDKHEELPSQPNDKGIMSLLGTVDGTERINLQELSQFRTLSNNRELQYEAIDDMSNDSTISAALEMYADDATQYNTSGKVIWVESEDTNVAAFCNRLIDNLGLNSKAWSHIYSLIKYGDLYLETFEDLEQSESNNLNPNGVEVIRPIKGARLTEYIEAVQNPAEVFDLISKGKTEGFIRTPVQDFSKNSDTYGFTSYISKGSQVTVLPATKFVHISLSNQTERYSSKFVLNIKGKDGKLVPKTYIIKKGRSILHSVYKSYKESSLLEDSLLLNRITKASLIRMLQVEVGDMPPNEAATLIRHIKQTIESKNYLNREAGTFSDGPNPAPVENIIYIPTHNGKGVVTSSSLGGDVDVRSIVDVDFFRNKVYAGLKTPKQYLGETDGGGFSGGTSLAKYDSRYARTIKRIQTAYMAGITTLLNIYAYDRSLPDYVNNFTVRMQSPSTTEDAERDEMLRSRVDIVRDLLAIISDADLVDSKTKKDVVTYLYSTFLNLPDVSNMLDSDETITEENRDGNIDDDSIGEPDFMDRPVPPISRNKEQ